MPTTEPSTSNNPMRSWLVVIASVAAAVAFICYQVLANRPGEANEKTQPQSMSPAQRLAAMNSMRDEALVIGVEVNGKAKAYALAAVHAPDRHVYNGMQGDTPVTVTFCDLADCVQVFTREGATKPLGVKIEHGASKDRKMVIRVDDHLYHQSTLESADNAAGSFPLQSVPFTRTTWGEWRKQHPDSELLTGNSN
jgi:hypothetical protein